MKNLFRFLILAILTVVYVQPVFAGDVNVNGYLQTRYDAVENGDDEASINRARLNFWGAAAEKVSYSILVDAVTDQVLWAAYIDIDAIERIKVRVGQFKTPFSCEYLTSSDMLDTIERSNSVDSLSSKYDIGMQLEGDLSPVKCIVGVFNGEGKNVRDRNDQKDYVERLELVVSQDAQVGVSAYQGKKGVQENEIKRLGGNFILAHEPISIKGEYISMDDDGIDRDGYYLSFGYSVTPKYQGVLKYDIYDPDKDVSDNKQGTLTLGLNCFLYDDVKLQGNYLFKEEEGIDVDNDEFQAQLQVSF